MILEGVAHVFGDHINTDYIISGKYKTRLTDLDKMAEHIMEDIRPGFYEEIEPGDFIVGGLNFGCGSSREAAAWTIKKAGISAVLAINFARIFFRNAFNMGLAIFEAPGVSEGISEGDQISVNKDSGEIINHTTGSRFQATPIPPFMQELIEAGGLMAYVLKQKKA